MPFFMRWLILIAVFFGLLIGLGAAIGVIERVVGGDLDALRQGLTSNLGGPVAILLLIALVI
jgi:hypothetical protein